MKVKVIEKASFSFCMLTIALFFSIFHITKNARYRGVNRKALLTNDACLAAQAGQDMVPPALKGFAVVQAKIRIYGGIVQRQPNGD